MNYIWGFLHHTLNPTVIGLLESNLYSLQSANAVGIIFSNLSKAFYSFFMRYYGERAGDY